MIRKPLVFVVACFWLAAPRASAQVPAAYGAVGDSWTAEYRADASRGGAYGATTVNWLELLAKYRDMSFGVWETDAFPRLTGYANDWASSGATSFSVLSDGQASGLASQVTAGTVGRVVLFIGLNDLASLTSLSGQALTDRENLIVANIASALDTIQHAGTVDVFVVNVPLAAGFTTQVQAINNGIQAAASARGIPVIDLYSYLNTLSASLDGDGNLHLGGALISFTSVGDEPHHALLSDSHPGTVLQGLLANLFVASFNLTGAGITPFSDQELLQHAGVSVTVPDTQAPSIALTGPASGATVTGTTTVTATAADNVGVSSVTFSIDGTTIGIDTTVPYSASWNTTLVANGPHALAAVARDAAGNVSSASVALTVANVVLLPATLLPTTYTVMKGSIQSGTLRSLTATDGQALTIASTTSGLTRLSEVVFQFSGVGPRSRIDLTVVLKSSRTSTAVTLSVYDLTHSSWHKLTSATIGTSTATITAALTGSFASYINQGALRISIASSASANHSVALDLARAVVTP